MLVLSFSLENVLYLFVGTDHKYKIMLFILINDYHSYVHLNK